MYQGFSNAAAAVLCTLALPSVSALTVFPRQSGRTVNLPLFQDANHLGYFANIQIGTPPQNATVLIDTGSADLWIFSNNVNCTPSDACQGSSFNPAASSSYRNVAPDDFLVNYAGGNGARGDYISETVQLGGATISNVIMGLASEAGSPNGLAVTGIMGLGMLYDEALGTENGTEYLNLPYRLTAEGLIDDTAFSVYLDDISSQTSNLLFGGVDSDKYSGELAVFDVTPSSQGLIEYVIPITSMSLVGSAGNTTDIQIPSEFQADGLPALLDTGSTAMSLPLDIVRTIYDALPVYGTRAGPVTPCSLANSGTRLTFGLGGSSGPTINVNLAEVVRRSDLIEESDVCFFDIYPFEGASSFATLGDSFLRSTYVVFDPGNGQLGIAQANLNSASSNISPLSQEAAAPTGEAFLPTAQLGDGASLGGVIPGSTIGATGQATAPIATTAAITAALIPTSSLGSLTPLATGASAVSVVASAQTPTISSVAGTFTSQASAASRAATSVATQVASSVSSAALPQFTGLAAGLYPPRLSPILCVALGVFMLA